MLLRWIAFFSFCSSVWGYNLTEDFRNGFYWASLPISISVIDTDPGRKAELEEIAQNGVQEWESKTGLSLWDLASSGTRNAIRWSTNFAAETRMGPSSVLAVAIRHTSGPYYALTEIIINGNHPLNFNRQHLQTTVVHELGHTMGLDHSNDMRAVMAPTLQSPYLGLHWDDIQGMSEVHDTTQHRQLTGYISPLAFSEEKTGSSPLSCGTTSAPGSSFHGSFSLLAGMLIAFVRKIINWFKSLL